MKKKLTIAGICFAIMLSCSGLSSAAFASNVSEYISPCADGEESYIETLQAMDTYAFVNKLRLDFASAEKANDELALICAASALYERYYELSESEILAQVMDNSTAETLRVTYIQLYYNSFSFESVSKILRLLEIDDVPETLKICIIDYLLPEDSQTMDNLLENGESRMAFHTIKRLAKLNPSKGFDYAEKLLKNYQDYDEGRVRAALIVLGRSNDSLHQKLVLETSEALLNI